MIGWKNENGLTPEKFASQLIGRDGYDDVFRQEVDEARLVLSGNRAERTFYEEYVFQSDTVQAFAMEYPSALRSTYDPLLEQIAVSFRHGEVALTSEFAAGAKEGECLPDHSCPTRQEFASPPEAAPEVHTHRSDPPEQARPTAPGQLRILVWRQQGPGGKKLNVKPSGEKRLKFLTSRGQPIARGQGGKNTKIKKPGRKKGNAKGRGRGRGKKR